MTKIKAVIDGDIPPHRALKLYESDTPGVYRLGFPDKAGTTVDYVTTERMSDGQEIEFDVVKMTDWYIDATTDFKNREKVYVDTEGRVGVTPEGEVYVGWATRKGLAGYPWMFIKSSLCNTRFNQATPAAVTDSFETMTVPELKVAAVTDYETMTVPELKVAAKERGLTGYSSQTRSELIQRLESEAT